MGYSNAVRLRLQYWLLTGTNLSSDTSRPFIHRRKKPSPQTVTSALSGFSIKKLPFITGEVQPLSQVTHSALPKSSPKFISFLSFKLRFSVFELLPLKHKLGLLAVELAERLRQFHDARVVRRRFGS